MHTKPCRAGLPTFPLIIISLDDFCCLAIDSQATTHFFYKLSSTFSIFTHVHTTWSPPLTQGCVTTSSPGDRKALRGWQTWAQPLGWPLSHQVCWVVSEMGWGYHS